LGTIELQQPEVNVNTGISPTLANNELVNRKRAAGEEILDMGFGEAPFPTPPRLVRALCDAAREKSYLPVQGLPELCQAVSAHHELHTRTDMDAYDVVIGPGSKLLIFALQMAIPGDLLLPAPSWVSYRPQAQMLGQEILPVAASVSEDGFFIDASALADAISKYRSQGRNPTKLIINFPNNPTGLTIDDATLTSIADICRARDVTLISDEIYGRLSFDHKYRSASAIYPEGAIVTTGLSKHLSIGGWRFGVCLVPKRNTVLLQKLRFIASETWSCVAAPVQVAAIEAYVGHSDIEDFIRTTTDIHAFVSRYVAQRLKGIGLDCPTPSGGFYTWPDFGQQMAESCASSDELSRFLLEQHGVVTLAGTAFGESPDVLRLRLSGCDYDGEIALESWLASGKNHDIGIIAPKIVSAIDSIDDFVQSRQVSAFTASANKPNDQETDGRNGR
jgi:aspartate aminotransferase